MDSQFLFYLVGLTGCILISYAVMFVGETSDYYDREKNAGDGSSAGENSFGEWSYTLYLARRRVWYLLWGVPHLLGCLLLEVVALSGLELMSADPNPYLKIIYILPALMIPILFFLPFWTSTRWLDRAGSRNRMDEITT
ncbi:MAG: hypothetical protein ACP6IT_10865 [Candidatus Thorarchaeota archaeon]